MALHGNGVNSTSGDSSEPYATLKFCFFFRRMFGYFYVKVAFLCQSSWHTCQRALVFNSSLWIPLLLVWTLCFLRSFDLLYFQRLKTGKSVKHEKIQRIQARRMKTKFVHFEISPMWQSSNLEDIYSFLKSPCGSKVFIIYFWAEIFVLNWHSGAQKIKFGSNC